MTAPEPDLIRSPHTGWTRQHWEHTADTLLAAVRPHAGPEGSLIHLPGPASGSGTHSDGLEGFARTFLLAAFRAAGTTDHEHAARLLAPYAEGLAAGTDPTGPHRWPRPAELPQARVEAASLAIALHETRPLLWDRLPDAVRQRTVDWLREVCGAAVPPNNWVWFRAVVSAFLRSAGAPYAPDDIDHAIEATETWYAGEGWYSDGTRSPGRLRNYDHYNGWAMHLYPLWYSRIAAGHADPARTTVYRRRLAAFLDDAAHLVAANGSPLLQGRSLTYRFAAAAPFAAGALFDTGALAPGLTRRAVSGMVRHFLDHGATAPDGLLSLGWHHPFPRIRQHYSGPASPYWASKAFAVLLLPGEHPLWTATEEPLPVERGDFVRAMAAPGWIAAGTRADGIVRVANHGTDHTPPDRPARDDPFYARHAYTTHTAPELAPLRPAPAGPHPDPQAHARDGDARHRDPADLAQLHDSHVALLMADGTPSQRTPFERVALTEDTAVSRHRAHWPPPADGTEEAADRDRWPAGPWITTAALLHGPWEIRLIRVTPNDADADAPAGPPLRLRVGGHPLAAAEPPKEDTTAGHALVRRRDGLTSALFLLRPDDGTPTVHRDRHTNALGPHSATPHYLTPHPLPYGHVHAVALYLGNPGPQAPLPEPPTVTVAGTTLTVHWPGGPTRALTL
ncbi:DUF2264 domain-containing protein [Streptomyces harbinensis]|uniref:DUF2264 domain-containing protein n=1 Tax=Streptomyces harbinensis TaxID=1176198 RepID=A0A1I6VNV1_9ACTN|nr:DUF2264 domain-containing protein [Streptomyces harbinensis]SFT15415.1 hypothetical protein SAMN05444716_10961 [Streptomyces harbinensis]